MIGNNNLDKYIRAALSVAMTTPPVLRQHLFSLLPADTFRGPALYFNLGRLFSKDTSAESYSDIAKAANLDPIELVTLTFEDESFRPLNEHLIRLLTARQGVALENGQEVTQWAAAITRITEVLSVKSTNENVTKPTLFISAEEFLATSINPSYLISGLIEQETTGLLYGPSGEGKSFVALDIGLAVATKGITLDGRQAEQGLVLYLAGEGRTGLKRRVKAWQQNFKKTLEDLSGFYLSRNTISFEAPDIQAALTEATQLVDNDRHKRPLKLIVIDTLARHIVGDENTADGMGAFISAVEALRAAFTGCVALIVHHTGHSEETRTRARGSSALPGAMEYRILCDAGFLTFKKVKDGELPDPFEFKLAPVRIGTDETGEPITSCIVQYGERSAKNMELCLTPNEKLLLGIVDDNPDICVGDLRTAFHEKRIEREPDVKSDTLKKAFKRSLDGLIEKQAIALNGNIVKRGQKTFLGHSRTSPLDDEGDKRDTLSRECPYVPFEVPFEESDFAEVI